MYHLYWRQIKKSEGKIADRYSVVVSAAEISGASRVSFPFSFVRSGQKTDKNMRNSTLKLKVKYRLYSPLMLHHFPLPHISTMPY